MVLYIIFVSVYMCETICEMDYTIKYISESHYQEKF